MAEIAEAAANTSAEGGAEEASQELSQTKNSLVSELRAYLTELNSFYAQTTDATHID
jgi:F0F1-type ATP synthase membrane subunit b/b'